LWGMPGHERARDSRERFVGREPRSTASEGNDSRSECVELKRRKKGGVVLFLEENTSAGKRAMNKRGKMATEGSTGRLLKGNESAKFPKEIRTIMLWNEEKVCAKKCKKRSSGWGDLRQNSRRCVSGRELCG